MPVPLISNARRGDRRTGLSGVVLALSLLAAWPPAPAFATDLHAFWDSRCASCHRHAGEFARNHLKIKDGRLAGRKPGRDVCAFLVEHGAGPELADGVCRMLAAQSATPSLFKERCAGCHETAAELARTGIVASDGGALKGKQNGRELGPFLAAHGKLEPGELAIVMDTLRRVHHEVHDAAK